MACTLFLVPAAQARVPILWGIYPGGGAGAVAPAGEPLVDNQRLIDVRLKQFKKKPPVHLYTAFTGSRQPQQEYAYVLGEAKHNKAQGRSVELVVRWKPMAGTPYSQWQEHIAYIVSQAKASGIVSLQIGNEANLDGAPNASDGAFRGVSKALVIGVVAADQAARFYKTALSVGINWSPGPRDEAFFAQLNRDSTPAFRRSIDWIGLDSYPCTWQKLPRCNARTVDQLLYHQLRTLHVKWRGMLYLPKTVNLHVSEIGYPTSKDHPLSRQQWLLPSAAKSLKKWGPKFRLTHVYFFDLRDANSSAPSFEEHYGLLNSDYSPKPVWKALLTQIARFH